MQPARKLTTVLVENSGGASAAEYACIVCCVGIACIGGYSAVGQSIGGEEGALEYAICRLDKLIDDEDPGLCGHPDPRNVRMRDAVP